MSKTEKVAVVTGGAQGIGAASALALQKAGFKPVILDIDQETLDAAQEKTGFAAYRTDISDYASTEETIARVEDEQGPITVLLNNAGITRDALIHKMDPITQWQAVIDVNLTGAFNACRCVTPLMRERKEGRIISISSLNGQRGMFGQANYAAAKAGLLGLTRSMAQELGAHGITANAICPGFILTEMTAKMPQEVLDAGVKQIPVGRIGTAEDIASMVAYLASDEAGFINGATMSVNGGMYLIA